MIHKHDIEMRILRIGKRIAQAIQSRQKLSFQYKNEQRIVDPYIFGLSQANHLILSAYQETKRWRTFDMFDVDQVKILDSTYNIVHDYNPEDANFKEILCRVEIE